MRGASARFALSSERCKPIIAVLAEGLDWPTLGAARLAQSLLNYVRQIGQWRNTGRGNLPGLKTFSHALDPCDDRCSAYLKGTFGSVRATSTLVRIAASVTLTVTQAERVAVEQFKLSKPDI